LLAVLLAAGSPAFADVVTLNSGGTVHGNLLTPAASNSSKSVAVLTTNGTLIVFERDGVQQVKRGADPAQKAAAAKSGAKKQLTAAEKAWIPKVRKLVDRLFSPDRNQVRSARVDLLNIDDPDAIPALTQSLRSHRDESLRRLFVGILRNIRGPRPIYYLVDQSLVDPSADVRAAARQAIGEQRADFARPLYIHALRLGDGDLASRAALALAEIGDPQGEAIPYLIDALVSDASRNVLVQRAQTGIVDFMTLYTTPGLDMRATNAIYMGTASGSSTMPVYLGPPGMSVAQQDAAVRSLLQQSSQPHPANAMSSRNNAPQMRGSGTYYITPAVADQYAMPVYGTVSPDVYKRRNVRTENPTVLDVLVKLTDRKHPGYGYNVDNWHRWWTTERKNRDLQKPKSPDRVLPKSAPAQ